MSRIIIIALSLALAITCQASEQASKATSRGEIDTHFRLEQQRQRLNDIEQHILQEQRYINQWYAQSMAELKQTAERKARMLLASQSALWTYFTKNPSQMPYLFGDLGSRFPRQAGILLSKQQMSTGQTWASLRLYEAMVERYFLSSMRDLLMNEDFRNLLCEIIDSTDVKDARANLLRVEARRLIGIMDELRLESNRIEQAKSNKLAALAARGEYLKSGVRLTMSHIQTRKAGSLGVVAAICQIGDQQVCAVEGVERLLRPGLASPGGVKVVSIRDDTVEFEKGPDRWVQKVGQPASQQWN